MTCLNVLGLCCCCELPTTPPGIIVARRPTALSNGTIVLLDIDAILAVSDDSVLTIDSSNSVDYFPRTAADSLLVRDRSCSIAGGPESGPGGLADYMWQASKLVIERFARNPEDALIGTTYGAIPDSVKTTIYIDWASDYKLRAILAPSSSDYTAGDTSRGQCLYEITTPEATMGDSLIVSDLTDPMDVALRARITYTSAVFPGNWNITISNGTDNLYSGALTNTGSGFDDFKTMEMINNTERMPFFGSGPSPGWRGLLTTAGRNLANWRHNLTVTGTFTGGGTVTGMTLTLPLQGVTYTSAGGTGTSPLTWNFTAPSPFPKEFDAVWMPLGLTFDDDNNGYMLASVGDANSIPFHLIKLNASTHLAESIIPIYWPDGKQLGGNTFTDNGGLAFRDGKFWLWLDDCSKYTAGTSGPSWSPSSVRQSTTYGYLFVVSMTGTIERYWRVARYTEIGALGRVLP